MGFVRGNDVHGGVSSTPKEPYTNASRQLFFRASNQRDGYPIVLVRIDSFMPKLITFVHSTNF
jgi:hypothetical protein